MEIAEDPPQLREGNRMSSDSDKYTPTLASVEKVSGRFGGWLVTFVVPREPAETTITIPVLVDKNVDDAQVVTRARIYVANICESLAEGTVGWKAALPQ